MLRLRRVSARRWIARAALAVVVAGGLAVGLRWATGNLGTVEPDRVYRSAQLWPGQLARVIRDRGVRTVLNLRGPNPESDWYRAERRATLAGGATQVDFPMSSDYWLTRSQARALVEILDSGEPPFLIHCQWGAERTGLVAAFAELLRPGGTLDAALGQFSIRYLYVPTSDGLVMRGHVEQYGDWLRRRGRAHSPEQFRRWIAEGYRPGTPNRDQWPVNPYPLKVVTRPRRPAA